MIEGKVLSRSFTYNGNRLNLFWGLDWEGIPERLDPKRRLDGVDIVIGCVDTRKARAALDPADTREAHEHPVIGNCSVAK
jgi:hypothetical protein